MVTFHKAFHNQDQDQLKLKKKPTIIIKLLTVGV